MTSMVEKVARAIATADEQDGGPSYDHLMTMGKHVRENLYNRARAAIKAMREPTHETMRAMYEAMFDDNYDGSQAPMVGAGFDAAIDAALAEETRQ